MSHNWHGRNCPVCGKDHARLTQLPPEGDWFVWLIMAGRGWGKTRTGAETLARWAAGAANTEWAIISPKFPDTRTVCVEGKTGILPILEDLGVLAQYNRSTYEIRLTNGAKIFMYGAEDYRMGPRGRNLSGAWCDEIAQWPYEELWTEALMLAMRDPSTTPRVIATTTPRRTPLMLRLLARKNRTIFTRGTTFENEENLSPEALLEFHEQYDNTRVGRQELFGEMLEEVKGALWGREVLESSRVLEAPALKRIVVGYDPALTAKDKSDEHGILVVGLGMDDHVYVLEDASCRQTPDGAAREVVAAYRRWSADRIVIEVNAGGDYIGTVLRSVDQSVAIREVRASKGKIIRAEPAAAFYEQGRAHHVGMFPALEDQLCTYAPYAPEAKAFKSPDRLDALVWAITELMPNLGAGHALHLMREMLRTDGVAPTLAVVPDVVPTTTGLSCGFNGCGKPDAQRSIMGGSRVNLCPMHLEQLLKLRLAQVDEQSA